MSDGRFDWLRGLLKLNCIFRFYFTCNAQFLELKFLIYGLLLYREYFRINWLLNNMIHLHLLYRWYLLIIELLDRRYFLIGLLLQHSRATRWLLSLLALYRSLLNLHLLILLFLRLVYWLILTFFIKTFVFLSFLPNFLRVHKFLLDRNDGTINSLNSFWLRILNFICHRLCNVLSFYSFCQGPGVIFMAFEYWQDKWSFYNLSYLRLTTLLHLRVKRLMVEGLQRLLNLGSWVWGNWGWFRTALWFFGWWLSRGNLWVVTIICFLTLGHFSITLWLILIIFLFLNMLNLF